MNLPWTHCVVCEAPVVRRVLCPACSRSYDRIRADSQDVHEDVIEATVIAWAADRARRALRRRQRARQKEVERFEEKTGSQGKVKEHDEHRENRRPSHRRRSG